MTIDVTVTARYESLKDRVVIITGGGQGIGRGYAHHFAAQGAIPVIAELNGENGEAVQREVEAKGGTALAIQTDVASLDSVNAMAEQVLSTLGRIDVLINNAAVFSRITMAPFWELPIDEWQSAMDVNINGSFFCARAVVPAMQESKWGRIVNVTSGTVQLGSANYLHYITSKSAMIGMTRSMSRELGPWNVTVNTFWPGITKTEVERPSATDEVFKMFAERQCLPRMTTIEDLAKPMLFLCSEEAAYITGQIFEPDGGLSFN
ncbi:MAG: short-chain dehydrogenase [Rhodospirillaceae bacterium]|nr:short-chain dehydrogenase [Rhodospirillaceae bacterium]|tara:strand:+ start:31763 stop:32551 length:789 start_codon:yes stop_codon:yes gene_type:complete